MTPDTDTNTDTTSAIVWHQCPDCPKQFASRMGLSTHIARMHKDHNWSTHPLGGGTRTWKKRTEEERETRRLAQKRIREKRRAMGLNSKGLPLKQPNHYMRKGKVGGQLWTAERTRRFRRSVKATWRRKRMMEAAVADKAVARFNHVSEQQQTNAVIPGYGDAAEAIINAANVLRAVSVGMKISNR
jgi:hypothetical protein